MLDSEETSTEVSAALAKLLSHLDNHVGTVGRLLSTMLGNRDQWLRHVVGKAAPGFLREELEWHCQRKTGLIRRDASCKCLWMKSPFRYFKTSPEIIRLAVMM